MTFDFGPLAHFIDVTAQYSNAVLAAVLPYAADCAKKMELGPPEQFASNAVSRMFIDPRKEDVAGSIVFTNGFVIGFSDGHIRGFRSPQAYSSEQDPDLIPLYYGAVNMDAKEAVALARSSLKKLGISPESVFADVKPIIPPLEKVGTNVIPYYEVDWRDPRGGWSVKAEINANKRIVERLDLWSENLNRNPFEIDVIPHVRPDHPLTGLRLTGINPEYGFQLFPIVIREVTNCAARLGIPLPQPLTTNHMKRFWVTDNDGWPHSELELTNGMRFVYRNTNVCGYFAPDDFWNSDKRKIRISDFSGKWRMSDREMIALAQQTLGKLGYPDKFVHTEGTPELVKPKGQFAKLIPRCKVEWMYPDPRTMTQWAYVEIDADKGQIKAVYFDDESFRKAKPAIDVPISLDQ